MTNQTTGRLLPKRTYRKDAYDRFVVDVFLDGQNVAEMLTQEGYAKPRS